MLHSLVCPSCGAPFDAEHIKAGERLVSCPFCNTAVELPEDTQAKLKAVLGALAETNFLGDVPPGATVIKTPPTVTVVSMSPEEKEAFKKQFANRPGAVNLGGARTNMTVTVERTTTTATSADVNELLAKMGIQLPQGAHVQVETSTTTEPGGDDSAILDNAPKPAKTDKPAKPEKKSFWKRFGGK